MRSTHAHDQALVMRSFVFLALPCAHALSSLVIDTSSGVFRGTIDNVTPNVVQFLGIPYAEPPNGARRWLPALPKGRANGHIINATKFGPACPQYQTNKPTTWNTDAPEFHIDPLDYQSEDCLSVNIWAPLQHSTRYGKVTKLPVVIWIHGGSFQTGGAATPYHNPSRWVERSRQHIVVAIKYVLLPAQAQGSLTDIPAIE
jgi:acetylcholinesterase